MLQKIIIDNILGGISPGYFSSKGQYSTGLAIDPDMPNLDSNYIPSGMLRPTAMESFSGTQVTGSVMWISSNPKTTDSYAYASDGKVHTISTNLTLGTPLNSGTALATASGNGCAYYDNYMYFATNTDITRYGPLNGSASLDQTYWTTTLSKTALVNTTYPQINGIAIPNHQMLRHTNNCLYFTDVTSGNIGVLHFIKTKKTTVEGDTDDGSTYNALDFPAGYWPTALESYNTDLAVALCEGTNAATRQKHAKLSFWDTTSTSYQLISEVEFPDPIISALKNVNGTLYAFSGGAGLGCRVSAFVGGYSFKEVAFIPDSYPPLPGAVDHILNRIAFAGVSVYPSTYPCVYAIGSRSQKYGGGIHNILKSSNSSTTGQVTALCYLGNGPLSTVQPVLGFKGATTYGLDKVSTTYGMSSWVSPIFRIGKKFKIREYSLSLGVTPAASMTITPRFLVDDDTTTYSFSTDSEIKVINSTNYSSRHITAYPQIGGENNFKMVFQWSGTALCPIHLPIEIIVETYDRN